MKPTFSIVIPLYNSEKYIKETLNSLQKQTSKDFEVIIIDDKSTDRSVEVTKEFLELHRSLNAKLYTNRPGEFPKGVSGSRNYGISIANGEWICFLDSDDLFHPQKIETLLQAISGKLSKIVYHPPINFNDGERFEFSKTSIENSSFENKDILGSLTSRNFINTSSVTIQKDLLLKTGLFDNELFGIEDYYMWLNVSKFSSWTYINLQLTAYRERGDSLMGGRKFSYYITQNSLLLKKISLNPLFSKSEKNTIEKYLIHDVMHYYAAISINKYGTLDFLSGLKLLVEKGYYSIARDLLIKHSKFKVLSVATKIKKNLLRK